MLGEVFNVFISLTSHEGFNAFIWFNKHVHDSVKVIQYYMSHLNFFKNSIELKHQAFKTCHAQK